jgi:autotransporter-associated beta strand protein
MVLAAACAAVVALAQASTHAATATFDNGGVDGGLWSNDLNWDPDGPVEGNDANFAAAGAVTTAGTVTNVVVANTSVPSLAYKQFALSGGANQHATQINDGVTLTLNGNTGLVGTALYVGTGTDNLALNNQTHVRFVNAGGTPSSSASGGTLRIDNASADLHVRQTSSNTAGGSRAATLDLSGLSHFNANLRNFYVGVGDATVATFNRAIGVMTLAYDNTINANSVEVGSNPNNGTTFNPASRLFLGQNNAINANSILIGGHATPRNSAGFMPGITGGSLIIRGAGGVGRSDLLVGAQLAGVTSGTSAPTNVLDLSGATAGFGSGSIDARLGGVVIGRAGFNSSAAATARSADGTFTFNAGVVDADSVVIGDDNNTANAAIGAGTINVNDSAHLVVNNSLTLGRKQNAGASGAVGTLNVSGATARVRVSGPVSDAGGSSTINVNSGATLQARSLGSSASRIDAMTVDNGTIVVDVSAGLPSGAWGYVNNLTANNSNTIGLNFAPGTLSAGQTIQAIDYSTVGGGGFGTFAMAKQPARVTAHLAAGASSIDIIIDSADSPRWNGTPGNNVWDINVSNNWQLITAGTPTTYQEDLVTYSTTDSVLFNDLASETTVDVGTTIAPNSIAVNNPTKNYAFVGAGKITGNTGITKLGAGSLSIGNTGGNDFAGTIDIQAGTVSIATSNVLPDVGSVNAAGGTLALGDFSDTIASVGVSGGTVSLNNGTLTAGTVGVSGGSLSITGTGTVAANIMNYSGGAISLGSGSISATSLNLSNGVTLTPASGTITATTINMDNATLGAGSVMPSAINVTSGGAIQSSVSGPATITKTGVGTLTISGNNTYTGGTRLEDGVLLVTHDNALGATSGNTFIENGGNTGAGYLGLSGGVTVAEPITLSGRRGFTPTNTPPYNTNPHIVNVSGNNTLSGNITLFTGGTNHSIGSDAGNLTIAGNILNPITASPALVRFLHFRGAGDGEMTGNILTTGSETTDIVKLDAGTWTLSGAANGPLGKTSVQGGKLAFGGPAYKTATLEVLAGNTAEVVASGGNRVLVAPALTIGAGAKIDLKDNKLITNVAVGSATGGVYDGVEGMVQTAYTGGTWSGSGITTSVATNLTSIGVISAAQKFGLIAGATATFAGQTVTDTSTLAMYTYGGDANLDGIVSGDDYTAIDFNIATPGASGWANGDFNHDGIISGDDYTVIDFNIVAQGSPFPTSGSVGLSGVTAVPEPASLSVIGLVAASLTCRRRRRN